MAEATKPAEPVLSYRASESSDPAVHQLLAQRQAHAMNDDKDALAEVDKQLVALGFTEYKH